MKKLSKKRVFEIIQLGNIDDPESRGFDILIVVSILVNLFIAIFSTYEVSEKYTDIMHTAELITVIIFTVEYILRVWTAQYLNPLAKPAEVRIKYIFSVSGLIDFLSFAPFYVPEIFFPGGVIAFRMFRVIRILRLFRINRYNDSMNVISTIIKRKKKLLLSSVFIILILMVSSSILMYNLEHEAQPEAFKNAFSGFWWASATLLTVGYGDIYPITTAGRILGIILTFLGVGMVAIPTGILSAGFVQRVSYLEKKNEERHKKNYCPHCGKKLN